jgi:hypothetical protein
MTRALSYLLVALLTYSEALATQRDWRQSMIGMVTRCFDAAQVKYRCENFSALDESVRREELQIDAVGWMGERLSYSYERAIEGTLCQEHLARIRRLMAGVDQVCISAISELRLDTGDILAKWAGLETRRGEVLR